MSGCHGGSDMAVVMTELVAGNSSTLSLHALVEIPKPIFNPILPANSLSSQNLPENCNVLIADCFDSYILGRRLNTAHINPIDAAITLSVHVTLPLRPTFRLATKHKETSETPVPPI